MSQIHDSSTADVRQKLVNVAMVQVGQAVTHVRKLKLVEMRGCVDAWMLGPLSGVGTFSWQAWCPRDADVPGQEPSGYSLSKLVACSERTFFVSSLGCVDHFEPPREMTHNTTFNAD